jgi:putative ATPase
VDRLFDTGDPPRRRTPVPPEEGPLAARMRPRTLAEVVGQEHVLAPGSALRTAIEQGRPHSMVLYGPPGSGKTTIARIVAAEARAAFEELSAVEAGRPEVRKVLERAAHRRQASGEPTIFFLDEIHRFNKAQQDALLPAVEEGLVTLIGATTENPYFEVNAALLSRCQVYELHALDAADVEVLVRRAVAVLDARVDEDAIAFLAARSGGNADPRALEVAVAAAHAVEHVGLPECQYALAQAAIYLALAPKSNAAARAIGAARAHVREHGAQAPPAYLRSAGHALAAAALGHGRGYDYPHDRPGHVSDQELLPEGLAGERFYAPDDAEAALRERLEAIRRARGR